MFEQFGSESPLRHEVARVRGQQWRGAGIALQGAGEGSPRQLGREALRPMGSRQGRLPELRRVHHPGRQDAEVETVTVPSERGLHRQMNLGTPGLGVFTPSVQAAETCVRWRAGNVLDVFLDLPKGGWWEACGLFGALVAGGRFCGLNRISKTLTGCERIGGAGSVRPSGQSVGRAAPIWIPLRPLPALR